MNEKPLTPLPDPTHNIWRGGPHPLDAIFAPRNIAVIGATEKPASVGRTILWNLVKNPFGGTVFPVNPKRPSVLGIKAYPHVKAIPEKIDLAVIVTPAPVVPGIIRECVQAGVKGAIIISAGFKETGASGVELEKQILEEARRGKMRLIGPNCLGVMNPYSGLNATFAAASARPGNVGFISQSGALCTAVLDWSLRELVGFSAFVSIGSMLDVNWGDLIDYLGNDPQTQSILIYMESIGNARSFLSAAREVALTKPIIVLKAGRTDAAAKAAASHTGSLTGSDEVLDAAFRRSGVLRVNNISDLFYMAETLAKQPRPQGPRLAILTNAGGPGVLAADSIILSGGELADLSAETVNSLNGFLPSHWSHNNPVDILGDAGPERYSKAVEVLAKDKTTDGVLVVLTPQAMTDPTQTAKLLKPYARIDGKPILASWMGGPEVAAAKNILNHANIPVFDYPDTAARIFHEMWQYSYNLKGLYETPTLPSFDAAQKTAGRALVNEIISRARKSGRTILTEIESKKILAAYGIPAVETHAAPTLREALQLSKKIGFPVVLKLFSETITHKTDVGGVELNLKDEGAVKNAYRRIERAVREKRGEGHFQGVTVQPFIERGGYELILGSSLDPQFGPVLLFGAGGQLVEVFKDHALALPPLNTTLARRMMEETRIYSALKSPRGEKPVDLGRLEDILVQFSRLVVEERWIQEIDVNPLLVSSERMIALDARIILHAAATPEEKLPTLAIRPYPVQYAGAWTMPDGTAVTIRPIRPEDEPLMIQFHETLSEESVHKRYFHAMKLSQRVAHERLTRVCFNDYDREIALVVDRENRARESHEILAVARLSRAPGTAEAEFSIVVSDQHQHHGLGTELLRRILEVGRQEKIRRITAKMLPENQEMRHVFQKLGFRLSPDREEGIVTAEIDL